MDDTGLFAPDRHLTSLLMLSASLTAAIQKREAAGDAALPLRRPLIPIFRNISGSSERLVSSR